MSNKNILPIILIIAIIVLLGFILIIVVGVSVFRPENAGNTEEANKNIVAVTESADYKIDGNGKIKITNNLDKKICFSSCYPYHLERKIESGFNSYSYLDCDISDLAERCLNPKETKAFEFPFASAEEGTHRLAISVCSDCNEGDKFKEEQWFYSNEFNLSK